MKICVYAICKNESKFIDRWLSSLQQADYIVVLDTGSTDNTYQLLLSDKRVYKAQQKIITPWRFDVARNESMKLIPEDTDICVVSDLDQVFRPGWSSVLKQLWAQGHYEIDGPCIDYDEQNNIEKTIVSRNVHPNDPNWHWIRPIHEGLYYFGEKDTGKIYTQNFIIEHHPDKSKSRGSYLNLTETWYNEQKQEYFKSGKLIDPYCAIYYGCELSFHDRQREALKVFLESLEYCDYSKNKEILYQTYINIALSYKEQGKLQYALIYSDKAIQCGYQTRKVYNLKADILNALGRLQEALSLYQQILAIPHTCYGWIEDNYMYTPGYIEDKIAVIYYALKDKQNAIKYGRIAANAFPDDDRVQRNLEFYTKMFQPKVGVYAICKNEQKNMAKWLQKWVAADCICLIDTGSTDSTIKIIKEYSEFGSNIHFDSISLSPFDFGAAKQFALDFLKTYANDGNPWVYCCFDIDEFPEQGFIQKLKENWGNKQCAQIKAITDTGWWCYVNHKVHSSTGWHWQRPIHEALVHDGNYEIQPIDLTYYHLQDKEKPRDYRTLLQAHYQINKQDILTLSYLLSQELKINSPLLLQHIAEYKALARKFYNGYHLSWAYWYEAQMTNDLELKGEIYRMRINESENFGYNSRSEYMDYVSNAESCGDYKTACQYCEKALKLPADYNSADDYVSDESLWLKLELMNYYNLNNYDEAVKYATLLYEAHPFEHNFNNLKLCNVKKKKKICVYAMCKNESKFVKKWAESMKQADYIVVLDTGSTDNTYELLQNNPYITRVEQKVIDPWRFDVARNESLKLVPEDADILICTDLDEVLEPGWTEAIKANWICGYHWRGYYKYAWSHNPDGSNANTFWYDKIHDKNYKWRYPVHECLYRENTDMKLEHLHTIAFDDRVFLHHYPDWTKSRGSYLKLLELRAEQNPNDFYGRFYLARQYGFYGRFDDAIKTYQQVLNMNCKENKDLLVIAACYTNIGNMYKSKGDNFSAISYYMKSIGQDKTYRDPYLNLGELYNTIGMHNLAVGIVEQCLKKCVRHYNWLEDGASWSGRAEDILGVAYYYLQDYDKSINFTSEALKTKPQDDRLLKNLQFAKQAKEKQIGY